MKRRLFQRYLCGTTTFIFKDPRQLLQVHLHRKQQQYNYHNVLVMEKKKNKDMESINMSNKRLKSDNNVTTIGNNNNSSNSITTNTNTPIIEKCISSNDSNNTIDANNVNDIDSILDKLFDEYTDKNTDKSTTNTMTKSSWCLRTGLKHIVLVDIDWNDRKLKQKQTSKSSGTIVQQEQQEEQQPIRMIDLIRQHGLPNFYSCLSSNDSMKCKDRHDATQDIKDPNSCFESLCRIIIGQMVSTKAAQVMWYRFVNYVIDQSSSSSITTTSSQDMNTNTKRRSGEDERSKVSFTPKQVLSIVQQQTASSNIDTTGSSNYNYNEQSIIELLQKPVGLTKNKAKSIVDLAYHFVSGQLSEDLFFKNVNATSVDESNNTNIINYDTIIKTKLLAVKGIGQWTYEIFIMFFLEQSNILPLGDLGVRKGISIYCPNQNFFNNTNKNASTIKNTIDAEMTKVRSLLQCYEPYQSLFTYYMWRLVETKSSTTKSKSTTSTTITSTTK